MNPIVAKLLSAVGILNGVLYIVVSLHCYGTECLNVERTVGVAWHTFLWGMGMWVREGQNFAWANFADKRTFWSEGFTYMFFGAFTGGVIGLAFWVEDLTFGTLTEGAVDPVWWYASTAAAVLSFAIGLVYVVGSFFQRDNFIMYEKKVADGRSKGMIVPEENLRNSSRKRISMTNSSKDENCSSDDAVDMVPPSVELAVSPSGMNSVEPLITYT